VLRDHKQAAELAGRFGEGSFMVLVERGTPREVEAWANGLISKISGQVLRVGEKSLSCTLSIGISMIEPRPTDITEPIRDAMEALRNAQTAGGNRSLLIDHTDADTQRNLNDKIWVQYIKSALMENRFRLMQQPIASLMGDERGMFDVLVRMVDEHNQEVLPAQFMPIAERNDLMKNIDRWIVGASMSVCASRPVKRLFVRLSRDSVRDRSLPQWLNNQLKATRIDPRRIVFQVSEQITNDYLIEAGELAKTLRTQGFQFALEHFGTGRDPENLLSHMTIDYIKIDGTLVEGLAVNATMQERIRDLVERAHAKKIATIAERVGDANTMAVLWQLGVEFIQGYFVNEPEEVVLG
jgi:multidomain signaling protein FimX